MANFKVDENDNFWEKLIENLPETENVNPNIQEVEDDELNSEEEKKKLREKRNETRNQIKTQNLRKEQNDLIQKRSENAKITSKQRKSLYQAFLNYCSFENIKLLRQMARLKRKALRLLKDEAIHFLKDSVSLMNQRKDPNKRVFLLNYKQDKTLKINCNQVVERFGGFLSIKNLLASFPENEYSFLLEESSQIEKPDWQNLKEWSLKDDSMLLLGIYKYGFNFFFFFFIQLLIIVIFK